jgi:Ca-activated chloride channel family protein
VWAPLLLVLLAALVLGPLYLVVGRDLWSFEHPQLLALLAAPALLLWIELVRGVSRRPALWFSRVSTMAELEPSWVLRLARLPGLLRVMSLVLLVLTLARPRTYREDLLRTEGIDIMFVLDLSKSMEEDDLERNRLEAGKRTLIDFLRKRKGRGDRVGLVVFAREAMLQCPLTLDYPSLAALVQGLHIGDVPELGTAIGDAMGLALASLRRSDESGKVVILLSDGDWNRASYMDPMEATSLAVSMGVRVFTILLGESDGGAGSGSPANRRYAVNPGVLRSLARDTGGAFFHAGSDSSLLRSFEDIRRSLSRSDELRIGRTPDRELFGYFLWPALALLLAELLLRLTRWRTFP